MDFLSDWFSRNIFYFDDFDERLLGFTSLLFLSCNTSINVQSLADMNFKVSEMKYFILVQNQPDQKSNWFDDCFFGNLMLQQPKTK